MDGVRMDPSMNPLSSNFQHFAVKNVSQQMGSLKTNKELTENRDDDTEVNRDMVELSGHAKEATAQEHLQNAGQAGLLSEHGMAAKKKGENKTSGLGVFAGRTDEAKEYVGEEGAQAAAEEEAIQPSALSDTLSRVMDKDINQIKHGVPPEIFDAAKKIVEGQINHRAEPANSLTSLKPVPDITPIDVTLVECHPIMDIHDTNNHPMPVLEEEPQPA